MARIRDFWLNAVLVAVSAFTGFLLVELLIALLSPQPVTHAAAPDIFFIRYDGRLGWANKEGASGRYKPAPGIPATTVRINGQGLRGGPVPVDKKPGIRRILMLGDSNTFGYGVEEEERFSDLLEGRLPRNHEVLNLGVFGYGTDQEALLFEQEGLGYQPDIVVLGFSAGDLSINMNSINAGYPKPFFRKEGDGLTLHNTPVPRSSPYMRSRSRVSPVKSRLYRHSHLYRLILTRFALFNKYMFNSVPEMSGEEGMDTTVAIIKRLDALCRKNGCRLAVLLISHETWVAAESRRGARVGYYPALSQILPRLGIPVIDPSGVFAHRYGQGEKLFLPNDPVHLNARGNGLAAEALHNGLIRLGLVETPER
jgi:lysophospholipase L1-like esterase